MRASFWSGRPTPAAALLTLLGLVLASAALALAADALTPRAVRSRLPLEQGAVDEFFLTGLREDRGRVLVTSRRENSTWTRDRASQAGDTYWIRRYGDPARPGLPQRILLTSRTRGAHLFVPLAALDLERALAEREDPADAETGVRSELAQVYVDRSFAGLFLHLRFPKRPLQEEGPAAGEPLDYDLVVVRGNELRTTDFLLRPDARLYRALLADGQVPAGDFARNAGAGDELVLRLWDEPRGGAEALYLPLSLFDELGLCWGAELATVVDDRWRVEALAAYALHPASPELRASVAWNGALHLAARFEPEEERQALRRALEEFGGP